MALSDVFQQVGQEDAVPDAGEAQPWPEARLDRGGRDRDQARRVDLAVIVLARDRDLANVAPWDVRGPRVVAAVGPSRLVDPPVSHDPRLARFICADQGLHD